jgi:hypothetical protein
MATSPRLPARRLSWSQAVVVAAVTAMAVLTLRPLDAPLVDDAQAAPALPNAAQQRLQMIEGLDKLNQRLAALQKKLEAGEVSVRVSEIPEVTIAE